MKKILMILLCYVMVLGITGCGRTTNKTDNTSNENKSESKFESNEHTCIYEKDKYKDSWILTVDKNDNITRAKSVESTTYDNINELNDEYEDAKESCKEYENDGLKCTIEKSDMTLTITIDGKPEAFDFENTTWEKFKENLNLENSKRKYTCE